MRRCVKLVGWGQGRAGQVRASRGFYVAKNGCAVRGLLLLLGLLSGSGCDLDIDPDTLVRELRVLGVGFGEPSPNSEADVMARITFGAGGQPDVSFRQPSMRLAALSRLLRRVRTTRGGAATATLRLVCLRGAAVLFSPGCWTRLVKARAKRPPARQNSALLPPAPAPSKGQPALPAETLKQIPTCSWQSLFDAAGSGGGGTVTLPEKPVVLLLPMVVEVRAEGGDPTNPLDREVAFSFLRVIITLPGMEEPPRTAIPAACSVRAGFGRVAKEDWATTREL